MLPFYDREILPFLLQPSTFLRHGRAGGSGNRFLRDGGGVPPYTPAVYGLGLQRDGKIILDGYYATVGGVSWAHLARISGSGALDSSYQPNLYVPRAVTVLTDGSSIISGEFTTVNGIFLLSTKNPGRRTTFPAGAVKNRSSL